MAPRSRVCVVTGSRAEYGLLYWVLNDLRTAPDIELQLIVTGMHLAPEFGLTIREIEADGYVVDKKVEMLLASDTAGGMAKSTALGLLGMSDAYDQLKPDVVLVLGDRFEILAAATAALLHRVPLAHIAGGDVTEGAIDDSIRHAITKMAHVHLVTNIDAARRVRQMGEDPARIHLVGSPGLDHLRRLPLLTRSELPSALGAPLAERNLLVTFHPVTLAADYGRAQMEELAEALTRIMDEDSDLALWCTRPNADAGGRALSGRLDALAAVYPARVRVYHSLGQLRYLSLLAQVDVVVGNSSSGLYEAPSFAVPTVDIGARQRGRLSAKSVLHCEPERNAIWDSIRRALSMDTTDTTNPYGDGNSAGRIVDALRAMLVEARGVVLTKHFNMLEGGTT